MINSSTGATSLLIICLLLFTLTVDAGDQEREIRGPSGVQTGITTTDVENLLRFTPQTSIDEAIGIAKSKPLHQFTVTRDDVTYILLDFRLHVDATNGWATQWALFENNRFSRFVPWIGPPVEQVPYRGTTMSRLKDWQPLVDERIDAVLSARPMEPKEVEQSVRDLDEAARRRGKSDNDVIRGLVLSHLLRRGEAEMKKFAEEYRRNAALATHFSALRADVGMTTGSVDALFGKPIKVAKLSASHEMRIYGEEELSRVNHLLHYSPVAVIFENGKVERVLSYSFIHPKWIGAGE